MLTILLTLLYFFSFRIYISFFRGDVNIVDYFQALWDAWVFILCFNFIHIIWIIFILAGIFKRKKEFIFGGTYAIVLSLMIFVSFIAILFLK